MGVKKKIEKKIIKWDKHCHESTKLKINCQQQQIISGFLDTGVKIIVELQIGISFFDLAWIYRVFRFPLEFPQISA